MPEPSDAEVTEDRWIAKAYRNPLWTPRALTHAYWNSLRIAAAYRHGFAAGLGRGDDGKLKKLPSLALMLPIEHLEKRGSKEKSMGLLALSDLIVKGVQVKDCAETCYWNSRQRLYVLSHQSCTCCNSATQLLMLTKLVAEATVHIRPQSGPWMWPLHDSDVAESLAVNFHLQHQGNWIYRKISQLRIFEPEGHEDEVKRIRDQYGPATAYVFAWTNLYARGLWCLTGPVIVIAILTNFFDWARHLMSSCLIVWATLMSAKAATQISFLNDVPQHQKKLERQTRMNYWGELGRVASKSGGAGLNGAIVNLRRNPEYKNYREIYAAKRRPLTAGSANPVVKGAGEASTAGATSLAGDQMTDQEQSEQSAASAADEFASTQQLAAEAEGVGAAAAPLSVTPQEHVPLTARAFFAICLTYLWAWLITAAAVALFSCCAAALLSGILTCKIWLIYEWGDCFEHLCDDPVVTVGFAGMLANLGPDILLALLLNVLTGEACKGTAFHLARQWNFQRMRMRQLTQAMLALLIDVLATVGMFVLLAFWFLPAWEYHSDEVLDPRETCAGYQTYELCRSMFECEDSHRFCCAGAIGCARAVLPRQRRERVFKTWMSGLFMIVPFVDILVQIVFPVIANKIRLAADRPRSFCFIGSKLLCFCFLKPLGRLLGLIFLLDAEVTGFKYICSSSSSIFQRVEKEGEGMLHLPWAELPPVNIEPHPLEIRVPDSKHNTAQSRKLAVEEPPPKPQPWYAALQARRQAPPVLAIDDVELAVADPDPTGDKEHRDLDGPLEQVVLRSWDALEELIPLKIRFLCVVLFAPIQPIGLIPNLAAAILEVHLKLPKLFLLKRRNFPLEHTVAHVTQILFTGMIVPIGIFWHVGIAMVSTAKELYKENQGVVISTWILTSCIASILGLAVCYFLQSCLHRRSPESNSGVLGRCCMTPFQNGLSP